MKKYNKNMVAFTQQLNSNFFEFQIENFLNVIFHKLEERFT